MKIIDVCIIAASATASFTCVLLLLRHKYLVSRLLGEAKEEFFADTHVYYSVLQPLYLASVEQDEAFALRVVALWKQCLADHKKMSELFYRLEEKSSSACELCRRLMDLISAWGVRHDLANEIITLDGNHQKIYMTIGLFQPGTKAAALLPAWYYEKNGCTVCITMGVAVIQEERV